MAVAAMIRRDCAKITTFATGFHDSSTNRAYDTVGITPFL
jgi:hypothetical protein